MLRIFIGLQKRWCKVEEKISYVMGGAELLFPGPICGVGGGGIRPLFSSML
jgi:hypothetical protein